MTNDVSGIYSITNIINNKQYIGQSKHIFQRFVEHKCEYNWNKCGAIYKAFKKYGINKFKFIIIEYCSEDNLDEREVFYIKNLNTLSPDGYNLNTGGNANKIVSEETREKMRLANLGDKNPMFGKIVSKETREKIRLANLGREITKEWRNKISNSNRGKIKSQESIEKMRITKTGKPNPKMQGENHPLFGIISKTNKGGYIVLSKDRVRYCCSIDKKEVRRGFSINKYGYVNALKMCFDLWFNKINYFEKLLNKIKI